MVLVVTGNSFDTEAAFAEDAGLLDICCFRGGELHEQIHDCGGFSDVKQHGNSVRQHLIIFSVEPCCSCAVNSEMVVVGERLRQKSYSYFNFPDDKNVQDDE